MLTMIHSNPAKISNGKLSVDRKFHLGMLRYAEEIRAPLTTVHPSMLADSTIIDPIEIALDSIPYSVMTIDTDSSWRPLAADLPRLRAQIANSRLMYGTAMGSAALAREANVPYVMILEYDLGTQIVSETSHLKSAARRVYRAARCVLRHVTRDIPQMRAAQSIHCNGYPIFYATQRYNPNRLLYLDSRMSADMLMSGEAVRSRLQARSGTLRLLYSGRYEPMKGSVDAVKVAWECLRRGVDVEMHCYGQGSSRAEMERVAARTECAGRVFIHDVIPYPELVKIAQTFDVFVCCHIQSDPSCTYLESFGAGLPIVGYGNRMWHGLCAESGAGFESPMHHPEQVAQHVQRLSMRPEELSALSAKALAFAQVHCFEREFAKRIDALNRLVNA
jgi:colanic acid/amylovoran biosynthesis glycosyltransferase